MYSWNPTSFSTPLERARPQSIRGRPDLSGIPETPLQERPLSPSKLAPSSFLVRSLSNNEQYFATSKERVSSPAREPVVSSSAPISSRTSTSLLSPRTDDEYDNICSSSPCSIGPSLSSDEKLDLDHANLYLDACIKKDLTRTDIADQLVATNAGVPQPLSSSGAHPDDYASVDVSHFRIAREYPISDTIVLATQEHQSESSLGSFPALRISWAFIDAKLYLWSWEDYKNITTLTFPEFVTAVGLLDTSTPGFQHFGCSFVIVTATLTEVFFSAVNVGGASCIIQSDEYVLRISTNDQRFCQITTTNAGRIFLGSVEGCVFELQNIKETMLTKWLRFGPKLVNCTLAVYQRIACAVPVLWKYFVKESITQMVMDETRKILYTLRKDNNVDLYDLGYDGSAGAHHVHLSFQDIVTQALPLLRNVDRLQVKQIVSVHPIETWESIRYAFFLLTSAGLRLYFAISQSPKGDGSDRPNIFLLGHIRFPPGHNPSGPIAQITSHLNITQSFYMGGTVMMVALNDEEDQDNIVSVSHDLYIYEEKFRESVAVCSIPYRIESIKEFPQRASNSLVLQTQSPAINQLMTSRKHIVVMTLKKCYILEASYPIDIVEKLLRSYSPMSPQIRQFIEWLPPFHSCFLSLHLACSTTNGETARLATRILRIYGGEPVIVNEVTPGTRANPQGYSPASPVSVPVVIYSAKHDAVFYLVGRIVAPFWNIHPFVYAAEYKGAPAWISGIPQGDIAGFVEQLNLVKKYLDITWNELFYPGRSVGRSGMPSEATISALNASKAEMASIKSLAYLLECTIQLLHLWNFLIQEDFLQVVLYVHRLYAKETLSTMTFSDLLVNQNGKAVLESVIKAVHQFYIDQGTDTETILRISAHLQELCPRLFNTDDATTMKVITMIDKAKEAADRNSSTAMLELALSYIRPNATIMGLNDILDRLTESHFFEAAVELCSQAALQTDPQNYAVRYVINNEAQNDMQGKAATERRQKYYAIIAKILSDLESASSGAPPPGNKQLKPVDARVKLEYILDWIYTKSMDVLLHFSVFEWCFNVELDRYATASNSPFLKDYLFRKLASFGPADGDSMAKFLKMITDCCERTGDKWTAAKALNQLALQEYAQIPVTERLESLSRAGMLCQTLDPKLIDGLTEFLSSVQTHFTLASVQRDLFFYIEEKNIGASVPQDVYNKVAFELLDANKLFAVATEVNAPHWTLVIMGICGEPPKPKLIIHAWGKFLQNVLVFAGTKRLSREGSMAVIVEEVTRIRSHLPSSSQYCALDLIVEGFESRYVTFAEMSAEDPSFVFDCVLEGLGQNLVDVIDVYHKMFTRYTGDSLLSPHLLRAHVHIVNCIIDDRLRKYVGKEHRRAILLNYVRCFDGYLRSAMKLHPTDEDLLSQVQSASQRLSTVNMSGRL